MKKTEKIEIRVSPEDKAALMRLSQQGGRSVSETVRGLLLNQSEPPPGVSVSGGAPMTTRRFAHAAGGAAFGAAVAAGLFASFGQVIDKSTEYRLQVVVLDGPEAPGRAYKATSVISIDRAATTQMRMPINGTEAYRVDVDMARQPGGTVYARFTICREMAASCVDIAKPALTAGENEPASINIADNEGRSLMIGMYPADAQVPG